MLASSLFPALLVVTAAPGAALDAQAVTAGATATTPAIVSAVDARECVPLGRAESKPVDGAGVVALASLLCVDDGRLVEERFIERAGARDEHAVLRRDVPLPLQIAAAPTISIDDDEQHHRRALIAATRKVAGIDFDVGGLMILLREDEAAREVVARALSTSAPREVHPIFGQDLAAVPWVQLEGAAVFSASGALLAVTRAHGGPPQPAGDGYGGYVSLLLKTATLGLAFRAPGFILGFDGEAPIVTALIARCGRAPVTAGEFFTPSGCADKGDERWEAVFDIGTGRLRDVRGPFHANRECGEAGPEDMPARYQWCTP